MTSNKNRSRTVWQQIPVHNILRNKRACGTETVLKDFSLKSSKIRDIALGEYLQVHRCNRRIHMVEVVTKATLNSADRLLERLQDDSGLLHPFVECLLGFLFRFL